MPRASAFVHSSTLAYQPSYDGSAYCFKATTAVATVQRLADLVTIPSLIDETYSMSGTNSTTGRTQPIMRPPYHVMFQIPASAANTIFMTWDNVTNPAVGGPGMELQLGNIYKFENAGDVLLRGGYSMTGGYGTAKFQVDAKTAFQFIASAATDLLVTFSD